MDEIELFKAGYIVVATVLLVYNVAVAFREWKATGRTAKRR